MSYTNSAGPDQLPRFEASDLDLQCLPIFYQNLYGMPGLRCFR